MEGEPLGEGRIEGVDYGGQRHMHEVEVVLTDRDRGSLPQLHGVAVHEFLGEASEVLLVDVAAYLGVLSGLCELIVERDLDVLEQIAPLREGVAVRNILLGV